MDDAGKILWGAVAGLSVALIGSIVKYGFDLRARRKDVLREAYAAWAAALYTYQPAFIVSLAAEEIKDPNWEPNAAAFREAFLGLQMAFLRLRMLERSPSERLVIKELMKVGVNMALRGDEEPHKRRDRYFSESDEFEERIEALLEAAAKRVA
jgi:hypothetical protein